jgi:hypothetical protein
MRLLTSAKRWISVFANVQESAVINARNVMNLLMTYLEAQEGRMTSLGRTGKPCHAPIQQVLSTGSSPDRLAIRSR